MADKTDKPNFSLLIGKRLDAKDGTEPPEELPDTEPDALPMGGEVDSMQDSAVSDLMAAFHSNDIPAAKQALKDFLDLASDGV